MALVQALLAALTRSVGRLLNTAFSWATVILFGRVSQERQIYVSAIAFGSVIWLVSLVGVVFPSIGTFLVAFVPLPDWVDKKWVRIAMLAAAAMLPAIVGVVSIFMLEKGRRPRGGAAKSKAILKGYPYTIGLAMTLAMMTVFAPIIKIRALAKRWTSEHVPVMVKSQDYLDIVGSVQRALHAGGLSTERRRASWMLRIPTKILTVFAGGAVENLVAEQMTTLRGDAIEVVLHPSDLIINGRAGTAARARAIVAEKLVFTPANLTWDRQANELEDRLTAVWQSRDSHSARERRETIRGVENDLHRLEMPYEEWEVLFRELLLLQRALDSPSASAESSAAIEETDRVASAATMQAPALSSGTRVLVAAASICVLVVTYVVRKTLGLAQI